MSIPVKNYDSDLNKRLAAAWDNEYEKVSPEAIDNSWNEFRKKVDPHRKNRKRSLQKIYAAAAIVTILLVGYFYVALNENEVSIYNDKLVNKEVVLPDGSLIVLNPGASINYPESFQKRKVLLRGNAFFEVVRDSLRKFEVTSGNTTTTVLGTSFFIEEGENNNKNFRISLYSGRVLITIKDKVEAWALIPGESFSYQNGQTAVEKFETILSFDAGNNYIDVNYVEVKELLQFLSKRFNYSIQAVDEMGVKRVTLRINKTDSLEQILEVLSIINKTNYEVNHEQKQVRIF